MRVVIVEAEVPGLGGGEVYEAVADFKRYAELTEAVRSVELRGEREGGGLLSDWEVNFRNGILRWSEEDWFDRDAGTIRFAMVNGDFEAYSGAWEIHSGDDGPLVRYRASFDLGVPSLSHVIDPIAERALYDNMVLIMTGLLGPDLRFRSSRPA